MNHKSILLVFLLLISGLASYSQPGILDGDFDANGSVITSITSGHDRARSVVVQPNGKIVVTGTSGSLGFTNDPSDYSTVRYLSDGSLDASFGTNGIVTTNLGPQDRANSIALQSDGKIVVGGTSNGVIAIEAFAIVRYNQNGTVDSSFTTANQSGVFMGPLGDCRAIAIQFDGKIVAAGTTSNGGNDFLLARYHTGGKIDTTFGTNGVITTDVGGVNEIAHSMALQSDGKIVVAGSSNNGSDFDFAVVRYNSDGSLDNSFSVNGMVTSDFGDVDDGSRSVKLQPDGKIVVAGFTTNESQTINRPALVRYNEDGTLDNSFGVNGKVVANLEGTYSSSILQPDGKIIAIGGFSSIALLRYHLDGTLDTDFGVNGVARADIGLQGGFAGSGDLQPDGKIIVSGFASTDPSNRDEGFATARFISGLNIGVISFSNQDHGLLIYPNPIQESAVIEYTLTNHETISIDLYDISGRLVQSIVRSEERNIGTHKESWAIDNSIPSGGYVLTISNGVGSSSVQVVK